MAQQSWLLTDLNQGVFLPNLELRPADFNGPHTSGMHLKKQVLRGGVCDGVDVIDINNGLLRARVTPTRGMGIHRVWWGDVELGWRSPVHGPVHPQFVNTHEPSGIGWLNGFDEWLCRCGLESNGAPVWDDFGKLVYPLHGRIANLPAWRVEVTFDPENGDLAVCGIVDEAHIFGRKLRLVSTVRLRVGETKIHIADEVHNLSSEPSDFQLLYHINFGSPLLSPGAKLYAPVTQLVPRDTNSSSDAETWNTYSPPQPGQSESVHFLKLASASDGTTKVLLKASNAQRGAVLQYDTNQLPCFTLWKCQQPETDGYVTGLEPGTNYPNARPFEERHNRVSRIDAGAVYKIDLSVDVLTNQERVSMAEGEIQSITQNTKPKIFDQPQPEWSAVG